ncbi:hypothetical protein AJ79_00093 [Helicocarpus griseus UAMH5409]|uniref:Pentatricopeptide repeat domain-containing protein n=1 Tax=Helicocarpus griseus UAMH5409 TaxID=1447875 RepID=A0A2B7YD99_9EURO|nr:hypothetical protein AJ79_00093 [Helicocarpus griseus UAMH5409]
MRSHFSQRTIRAILECRPYSHLRYRRRLASLASPSCAAQHHQHQCPYKIQRRSLFGLSGGFGQTASELQSKKGYSANYGAEQMKELVEALEQKARPPPPNVIAKAFLSFLQSLFGNPTVLTAVQANFLLRTFEYLEEIAKDEQYENLSLNIDQLEDILSALAQSRMEYKAREDVETLARGTFKKIRSLLGKIEKGGEPPSLDALYSYISVLASTGSSDSALGMIEKFWDYCFANEGISPWLSVIRGCLREKDSPTLAKKVIERMERHGVPLDQQNHEQLVLAVADGNMVQNVKFIYECEIADGQKPTATATAAAANVAIRNGSAEWAAKILAPYRWDPTPEIRDSALLLAVEEGKGAVGVENELAEMCAIRPDLRSSLTTSTFRQIMEHMHARQEPYDIEAFASLARSWGLKPDTFTGLLRVSARVQAGDILGAIARFEELSLHKVATKGNDLRNVVLRQLCTAVQTEAGDEENALAFIDRILEIDAPLEAATLEAFCRMLLFRHDLEGVSELLKPLLNQYSERELAQVSKPFQDFIIDPTQPAETAWEVYEMLIRAFTFTPVHIRTTFMSSFFKRGRSDLGCLVFGHMRQKTNRRDRPTAATYTACFEGIAKAANPDGLMLVHNMLKLDMEVELNTALLQSLMQAYSACGQPEQAMGFFRDILHSKEGPTGNTLRIFFQVCATYGRGLQEATRMVEILKTLDIPMDKSAYTNYIRMLGAHGEVESATEAIDAMEKEVGARPTMYTIGVLYNALPDQRWRDQAESWAKSTYPTLWEGLAQKPTVTDEDGIRTFIMGKSEEHLLPSRNEDRWD